jgi:hypothetical protein
MTVYVAVYVHKSLCLTSYVLIYSVYITMVGREYMKERHEDIEA